ncbi:glycosyltransferase family 2 protein [Thermostichus vulcanus]|uniref:Glycosyltransferase n=1 Tax=Thermostichus vulcanus str. 'Rupite' TaxID=2813851 RepID=A0ABT0C6L7_THEVL|nr:glycosyltransferase family 2 protein [Thermostichus vulcanus]MCJ2541347.1 glycosyltransferase [Thermostichus vulcanus str. 'Rupite']
MYLMLQPIKVVELELTQHLPELLGLEKYGSIQALVRFQGIPLTYLKIPVNRGNCSPAEIRNALLQHPDLNSDEIEQLLLNPISYRKASESILLQKDDIIHNYRFNTDGLQVRDPWSSVTVAICTRDRPEELKQCLESLLKLDYPSLEILVVDNAPSSSETQELIRCHYPQVRYIQEPQPGLSSARNCAIRETTTEILAFTDDDVIVDKNWVRELSQVFQLYPEVMAVTGLIAPYELETEAQILFERRNGFGRGFQRTWVQVNTPPGKSIADTWFLTAKWGAGANMAFRRHFFIQEGGFTLSLGAGSPGQGGEDLEMFFRVLKCRYALVYEPRALVWHRHRRRTDQLKKQMLSYGIGSSFYCIYCAKTYPEERWAILRKWFYLIWSWHLRRLLRAFVRNEDFPRLFIFIEFLGVWLGLWQSLNILFQER